MATVCNGFGWRNFWMGFDELFFLESMPHHFSCIFEGSKTLPATNSSHPENGWLEDDRFVLRWPIFSCF